DVALGLSPITRQSESHISTAERRIDEHIGDVARFRVRRTQEFPPSGYVVKQIAHAQGRSHWSGTDRCPGLHRPIGLEEDPSFLLSTARPQGKPTDRCHAGQRLTSESVGSNRLELVETRELARCMPSQAERSFLAA